MNRNLKKLIETLELIVKNGPIEFDQVHMAQDLTNPAVKFRVTAKALMGCSDVKKLIERMDDWEAKVYRLQEALARYPDDVWWKTHQSHMDIISGFIGELRASDSDPIRRALTGQIVIRLYDELKTQDCEDASFDDLYACWDDIPSDHAIEGRLKDLRQQLLPHNRTISISMSKRTAQLKHKSTKKSM